MQQSQLNDEKHIIKLLEKVYDKARQDCENKIRQLSSRTDLENLQSIIYQKQYQEALKKQLDGIGDNLQSEEFTSIADYLQKSYHNGYIGVMYDLHKQGIPIITPINQEQVVKALQTDSKLSQGLYSRLGEDTNYLKRSIRAELSRGIANGSSWNEIAEKIAKGMNSPFKTSINNAIRIARTEGHRVQQSAALDAQYAAKEKGADIVKQWDSTLDNNTRPHHRQLDGQIRELDEPFEVDGMVADAPGHFGRAKEDCNCRCCLLQRARWALDQDELNELKERATYFGLDKTKDFEDFKQKYLKIDDNEMIIAEYVSSRKEYQNLIEKQKQLEIEEDSLLDQYMDALDTPKEKQLEKLHNQKYDELESVKEKIKDIGALLSGKEAKAVRVVEKQLSKITGIDLSKIHLTGLSYDSAETVLVGYTSVLKKYPMLKNHISKITFDNAISNAYAGCKALSGEVKVHNIFKNLEEVVKCYDDDVRQKFHPIGTDYKSIIVHELGHALDGYLTKCGLCGGSVSKYGVVRSASEIQHQVLDRLGWFKEVTRIKDNAHIKGLSYRETSDEILKARKEFIKNHISEYAAENEKEFFAECFAEYLMSDNPREAANIFGEIIENVLKGEEL